LFPGVFFFIGLSSKIFIDAKNIANVLFDPSPEISTDSAGMKALEKALADLKTAGNGANAASAGE